MITNLLPNQIFVFGSNMSGNHAGGAAKQALDHFGAIMGQGEGLQGQSYAFPTLGYRMQKREDTDLKWSVKDLYDCCEKNPNKQFLLTKVGCGIAGFSEEYMKSLFVNPPKNLIMPNEWK